MEKYVVIKGIFENTIFNGTAKNNRVHNNDTIGQSYPLDNCIKYDFLCEILLKEGEKRLKGVDKTLSVILDFCDFQFIKWYFKIDFTESKNPKDIKKQMFNYLNNEGFYKLENLILNN